MKLCVRYTNSGFTVERIEQIDVRQNINFIEKEFNFEGYRYKYRYQMMEVLIGLKTFIGSGTCTPYMEFGFAPTIYFHINVFEDSFEGRDRTYKINEKV